MKKTRFLVLAVAVAVMLMGAGYAVWTDQLDINTTINTGNLDVEFEDIENELKLPAHVTGNVSYAREEGSREWDKATVTFSNFYPGARATVTLKMVNRGTIPVEMRRLTDTKSSNWGANGVNFNQIGASVRFFDSNGNPLTFKNGTTYANPWDASHFADDQLPVGGYATISFTFTASDNIDEKATFEFSPSVVWQQFNQDPNGGKLNIVE